MTFTVAWNHAQPQTRPSISPIAGITEGMIPDNEMSASIGHVLWFRSNEWVL